MQHPHARALLVAAYVVILLEGLIPVFDHRIDNPLLQWFGLSLVVFNIVVLVVLKPRTLVLLCAAMNGILAATTLIGGLTMLVRFGIPSVSALDFVIVLAFFAGAVPLIAAHFLYKSAAAPNNRLEQRDATPVRDGKVQ